MYYTSSDTAYMVSANPNPECFITTGKQRKKIRDYSVYLKEGEEFEIELFNPRTRSILAIIDINGSPISEAGIVIKPGQRVFLERWIESDKKFKFSTYLIDSTNGDVLRAIENNGKVRVTFYDEKYPVYYSSGVYCSGGTTGLGYWGTGWNTATTERLDTGGTFYRSYGSLGLGTTPTCYSTATTGAELHSKIAKEIETGRVEQGSKSNQTFGTSDQQFNSYSFYTLQYQLLPESRRPLEVQDLKRYCTECGARIKKSTFKFCPHCGTRLE